MPDSRVLTELIDLAPRVDLTVIRILAALLGGETSSDVLFAVADVLRARAVELSIEGLHQMARELRSIATVVAAEATLRAGRGNFW